MRATEPVYQIEFGPSLISAYDYVADVLRDPVRFSSDERNSAFASSEQAAVLGDTPFGRVVQEMLVFRDEPDHKRLRDLVQKAFTRKVVENLRPRIVALVDELVDTMTERGRSDLISDFAYPLPVIVICELLGVPAEDRMLFQDWARDFGARFEVQPLRTPEMEARGDAATMSLIGYVEDLIAEKRRRPAEDLLSSLVSVEDAGDRLSHDELVSTALLLLFAGHETTANLIGNGTLALLRNREQWELLVDDPTMARAAVEEVLRYDSPVQFIQRVALQDVAVGGRQISSGAPVALMLGAANRDPDRFPDPDRLDIARDDSPLVAFGGGIHFCLGAPLARLEAQISFSTLARRIPGLDFGDGDPQWRPSFVLRGLTTFPVRTG